MTAPTIILRHRRERKSKCSLQPLVDQDGFDFYTYPDHVPEVAPAYLRLAVDAPVLTAQDADRPLLLIDGTWRLIEPMNRMYAQVEARSLPPLKTAYPRTSKLFDEPEAGLASIEALAAAYHLQGRPYLDLLADYRWTDTFIRENSHFFGPTSA